MDDREDMAFRFPLTRTLPLLVAFLFILLIIAGSFVGGNYHPVVTVILWLGLIGSGWFGASDLATRVVIRENGLQIRSLSLRGVRTHLVPWDDVRQLDLSGRMPDTLQLVAQNGVSTSKWTLPAQLALAEAVVQGAGLQPDSTTRPQGVHQAFDTLRQTRTRSERYLLRWRWRRVERELGDD
jgi:hypothetical protein